MKRWRFVLRIASDSEVSRDTSALKRNIAAFIRVVETYEVQCLGMRMFGVDFIAEEHEFNHIMIQVKFLEERYRLSIMQFSELRDANEPEVTIRVGSKPAAQVA